MAKQAGTRIKGLYYDFSSIEIAVGPGLQPNITDINYSQKLDPGTFRGTGAEIKGRTRGTYDADGSFTIYKEDYEAVKYTLMLLSNGEGYMVTSFPIIVCYREEERPPCVDLLVGCRITNEDHGMQTGNNPAVVKVNLSIMKITTGLSGDQVYAVGGGRRGIPGVKLDL